VSRSSFVFAITSVCGLATIAGQLVASTPSEAGRRNTLLGIAGGAAVLGVMNELSKAANSPNAPAKPRQQRQGSSSGGGGSKKAAESTPPPAPVSDAVAKDSAAKREEWQAYQIAQAEDRQRDVDKAIDVFLFALKSYHTDLRNSPRVHAAALNDINQVTKAEVRIAVEDAYKNTNLAMFDRVPGDLWTKERLMVLVLTQAQPALRPFFEGVGAKGPSMQDIQKVIADAAGIVYNRTLEANELLGVSFSYERLIRAIYEHSDGPMAILVGTDADEKLDQVESAALGTSRTGFTIRPDAFATRYRARRILYDCLSSGLPALPDQSDQGKTIPVSQPQTTAALGAPRTAGGSPPPRDAGALQIEPAQTLPAAQTDLLEKSDASAEAARFWQQTRQFVEASCKPIIRETTLAKFDPVPPRAQWEGNDITLDGQIINTALPSAK